MSTPTDIRKARRVKTKRSYADAVLAAFDAITHIGNDSHADADHAKRREALERKAEVRRKARNQL